jgi:transposase
MERTLSENRRYRKFTAQQKTELVLASLRGPKTIAELCREHDISDSLLRKWREQFLAAGAERLSGKAERTGPTSCAARSRA